MKHNTWRLLAGIGALGLLMAAISITIEGNISAMLAPAMAAVKKTATSEPLPSAVPTDAPSNQAQQPQAFVPYQWTEDKERDLRAYVGRQPISEAPVLVPIINQFNAWETEAQKAAHPEQK